MFARVKYALVVVALAACGKSKDECRVEAKAAGDLLVAAARELPLWFEPPDDLPLVTRTSRTAGPKDGRTRCWPAPRRT